MNDNGFGYSFKTYGVASHEPKGWPKALKWENWKPNCCKKEQGKLIVKSILDAHGIIAEEFHLALGISPEQTVSSLNKAPSSEDTGNLKEIDQTVENEDEKAPQVNYTLLKIMFAV